MCFVGFSFYRSVVRFSKQSCRHSPLLRSMSVLLQSLLIMTQETHASHWSTIAIYGVGLIGGSIGMALRKRELCEQVVGIGRNADRLQRAKDLGAIDEFVTDPKDSPRPNLVILCAPVQLLAEHCQAIAQHFPNSLITDGGSTKAALVRNVESQIPTARFVGSHPLAGSDKSGVEHSGPNLYQDRVVVVTPTETTHPSDVLEIAEFWKSLGARIVQMSPEDHDAALAMTSHVPHVLAAALASSTPEEHMKLVAGGWRDSTRIAGADVELWRQILQENRDNVLHQLAVVRQTIEEFELALCEQDQEQLIRLLTEGKQIRDAWEGRRDALGN